MASSYSQQKRVVGHNGGTLLKSLRHTFADLMLDVGLKDPRLVVFVGDISHGILQPFATCCPDRYYNIGICEPSMVSMAAGLAKVGLIPVVHTIAPFITERSYEQIKLDFGYQELSGNFITVGGSFDYSQLGCSHHCYTDYSLFSHLVNSIIVAPGSSQEFRILFTALYAHEGPKLFRLNEYTHNFEWEDEEIKIGKGIRVREGSDITLITFGYQLENVNQASSHLFDLHGISSEILYW